jgi:hypothetical protein
MEDLQWQADHILGQADRDGIEAFVVIIDMENCSKIPFDLRNIKLLASSDVRIVGYVIMQGNPTAKMMIRLLGSLTFQKYRAVETLEAAFADAQTMLAEHAPSRA